jgi:hypothetical protein
MSSVIMLAVDDIFSLYRSDLDTYVVFMRFVIHGMCIVCFFFLIVVTCVIRKEIAFV